MKTTALDGSCRTKCQPKNSTKMFLFVFKQKVGSLVFGKDHKVSRPKKMFRLCIRDEYGMRALAKPTVVLKSTALYHEIQLREGRWRLVTFIDDHMIHTWPIYREKYGPIGKASCTINNALRKYSERRLEAGLFYLVRDKKRYLSFTTRSHLYGDEFLKGLWRKKRLERTMQKHNQELLTCSASVSETNIPEDRNLFSILITTLRVCGMRHVFYMLLVISLALAIVYL
ncbi:unnamed protein product [Triticum aestivum]|uniref:Uncharacterized protein n=2 Tax=Triticum aestivum TaxID=4565 RepID=A0A9R1EVW7_WHEAT|nr:uncharacterized protein LOC123049564 [Triticum aestivum]KAF7017176.1 hypothetical protein CFC21_030655 [Triticum aestivum]SPT18937.1 unnamed protein product [Triticum aestivum]